MLVGGQRSLNKLAGRENGARELARLRRAAPNADF